MSALNARQQNGPHIRFAPRARVLALHTTAPPASEYPIPTAYVRSRGRQGVGHEYRMYNYSLVFNASPPCWARPVTLSGALALPPCASFTQPAVREHDSLPTRSVARANR